jgi:hypothetical protein
MLPLPVDSRHRARAPPARCSESPSPPSGTDSCLGGPVALSGLPRLSLVALQHQRAPCLLSRAAARSSGRSRCRRRQSTGPAVTIGKRTVLILDRAGEQAVGQDPRERIFSALTESAELARWWGPHGYTTPEIDLDLRVGGGYRFTMQPPGSDRFHLAVGRLLDPDLCCFCVGRSSPASRRACTPNPALSHGHARRPRLSTPPIFHPMTTAARRPAAAGYPLARRLTIPLPPRPGRE